jgi:hypothetical protein
MKPLRFTARPVSRVDYILSELGKLWHYYPDLSLLELVIQTTIAATVVKSDLPVFSYLDIEDIAYPSDHFLHETRNLEMGIKLLKEEHKDRPLSLFPVRTSILDKIGEIWRRNSDMRLGQLLSLHKFLAEKEEHYQANYL